MQKHPEQYASDVPQGVPLPADKIPSSKRLQKIYSRFKGVFLVGFGILSAFAALLLYQTIAPNSSRSLTQRDLAAAIERLASAPPEPSIAAQAYAVIRPSVVRVVVTLASSTREPDGVGTGVIIDAEGIILTNLHVVRDATMIQITFADGTISRARIIASDPGNDLAVLQADILPENIVPATLTSSATLNVGDEVVAVGNPFGLPTSVTSGVVSGLGRAYTPPEGGDTLDNLIQFDAAVNPGNSGGPLVNRNGEVVGIVTGLVNPTSARVFVGLGFAVPIEAAAAAAGPPWY